MEGSYILAKVHVKERQFCINDQQTKRVCGETKGEWGRIEKESRT